MKNWKYINGSEGVMIGNFTPNYRYKDFLITNPEGYEYIVFLKDGHTVAYRGTTSKAQAEDWCDWHDAKTGKPVKNTRIGNGGITVDSAVAKEIRELAGKHWHSGIHDSRTLALTVAFELAKKYDFIRETKDDFVSKAQKVIDDFIKQTKTGNDTPEEYAKRPPKIVGGNSLPEELEKDVEKKDKEKVEDIEELKKTGNALKYTNIEDAKRMCKQRNDSLSKDAPLREYCGVYEKDGVYYVMETGEAVAKEMKRVRNQSPQERLNQDLSIIKEECRKKGTSLSFSELAKELEKYGWDFNELRKLKLPVRVGNSSADDKFAYVMREFDEGKLKTPDGKVVTDPAQAKAIAYSESKKTENGLARARNAIKK